MKKAYVITAGSYSDYHIIAVFGDRAQADEFCLLYHDGWEKPAVEEFILNEVARDAVRYVAYGHPSTVSPDAPEVAIHHERMATIEDELNEPPGVADRRHAPSPNIVFHGYGRTPEEARKSALDHWYKWKAEKVGVS